MDVALASIIASGVVALAAILAPIVSSLVADSLKWRRESKAARKAKIETAAADLFASLAPWPSGNVEAAKGGISEESLQ